MKTKLFLTLTLAVGFTALTMAQFSTGTVVLTGAARTIKIDTNPTTVTLTLTGPSTTWLGVGFGGTFMSTVSDMFIWNATTNRDYTASGSYSTPSADAASSQSWTITSDTVAAGVRTVVATRALISAGDYTFLNNNSTISIIFAQGGTSTTLGSHGQNPHAGQDLPRQQLGTEDFSLNATSIFPNPSNGNFNVQTNTNLNVINIYSQTGQLIRTINVQDKSNKVDVNVNGLSTGIYLIELKNDTDKSWKKVIVE